MVTDESRSVGRKIRLLRQERKLSVEQLAERTGCSAEYLEWVEEGQVFPPVALLLRLAQAMQLDRGAFLDRDESPESRLEEAAKRAEHYSYQTLTPPEPDKRLMAFSIHIPPRTAHEGVGYSHEGEEYVYVLSGQVELTVGEDKRLLAERESFRFNSSIDHHLANPGDEAAELLVVLYVP